MSNGLWDGHEVKGALAINLTGHTMVLCAQLCRNVPYYNTRRLLWVEANKEVLIAICEKVPECTSQQLESAQQG